MESRRKLAIAILCYSYLRNHGFITSEDREGIFGRILSWAYKKKSLFQRRKLIPLILSMTTMLKKRRNN